MNDDIILQAEKIVAEKEKADLKKRLFQFYGSETFYEDPSLGFCFTEGIKFLVEETGAGWLLELIAIFQTHPKISPKSFQVYELNKKDGLLWLTILDGYHERKLFKTQILDKVFPLDKIRVYRMGRTVLLPMEY